MNWPDVGSELLYIFLWIERIMEDTTDLVVHGPCTFCTDYVVSDCGFEVACHELTTGSGRSFFGIDLDGE